jgi:AmmeMemoRadiSam system protein A
VPSLAGTTSTKDATGAPAPPVLSGAERQALLHVARVALARATGSSAPDALERALRAASGTRLGDVRGAAFVTLMAHGELRACMGTAVSAALPNAVAEAAVSAALRDPRFSPLEAAELRSIRVEISVLGSFAELSDPVELLPGVDGVLVERGWHRGLLLPEVASRMGWDGPELLAAACHKAGLPDDAWRDPGTRVLVFRTVHFGAPACEPDGPG